jgi:hypothetical protein
LITHGFDYSADPNEVTSSPSATTLTFNVVEAATLSIEDLPDLTADADIATVFGSIDITTTNVDASELSLSDFTLVRVTNGIETIVISDLDNATNTDNDWEDFAGVSLFDAGGGVYQILGLDDVIDLADGDYTLTAVAAGVKNAAGVSLIADVEELFEVDSVAPQVSVADVSTSDSTPTLTGTVIDQTLDTMSITITHANDSTFASQTFTLANGDFSIDGNGNWTLDGTKLSALEGGTYDVRIVAVDEAGQIADQTFDDKLLIFDTHEVDDSESDAPSNVVTGSRQYNLSIHESGDADWKSFVLDTPADVLVLGSVISGDEITVKLYLYNTGDNSIPETPNYTFTSVSGVLSQTIAAMPAGTYYIEITSSGDGNSDGVSGVVYNYNFIAGIESALSNSISGSVFVDENFDGTYNAGDGDALDLTGWNGGLGVLVELYATNDLVNPVDSVYTTDGSYTFSNVVSDTYLVRVVLPDGTFQTTSNPAEILLDGAVDQTGVDFGVRDIEVAGQYLFYNNSDFDDSSDDDAIDTSKTALLPGGSSSFANYSSSSQGINGIIIDLIGLQTSSLSASDFIFKVGEDNTPNDWLDASTPASITVREGEGVNGSDRVTIIWSDSQITNTWLQVTVLADGSADLYEDHVFYFGNYVGDVSGDGESGIDDVFLIWTGRSRSGDAPVGVDDPNDVDHDGWVDISDVFLAWSFRTVRLNDGGLADITVPAADALHLTGGQVESSQAVQEITDADLSDLTAQAIAIWQQAGASESQLDLLAGLQVQVTDLGGSLLGQYSDGTIYIDRDAAGAGWFIDRTPDSNEEFTLSDLSQWLADASSEAASGVDALTVILHEMGHGLGLDDVQAQANELMNDQLSIGVRKMPWEQGSGGSETSILNNLNEINYELIPVD